MADAACKLLHIQRLISRQKTTVHNGGAPWHHNLDTLSRVELKEVSAVTHDIKDTHRLKT